MFCVCLLLCLGVREPKGSKTGAYVYPQRIGALELHGSVSELFGKPAFGRPSTYWPQDKPDFARNAVR